MGYDEVLTKISANRKLLDNVSMEGEKMPIPFYKMGVIIAPVNSSLLQLNDIYTELVNTQLSNKEVLQKMNCFEESLDAFIITEDGKFIIMPDGIDN